MASPRFAFRELPLELQGVVMEKASPKSLARLLGTSRELRTEFRPRFEERLRLAEATYGQDFLIKETLEQMEGTAPRNSPQEEALLENLKRITGLLSLTVSPLFGSEFPREKGQVVMSLTALVRWIQVYALINDLGVIQLPSRETIIASLPPETPPETVASLLEHPEAMTQFGSMQVTIDPTLKLLLPALTVGATIELNLSEHALTNLAPLVAPNFSAPSAPFSDEVIRKLFYINLYYDVLINVTRQVCGPYWNLLQQGEDIDVGALQATAQDCERIKQDFRLVNFINPRGYR